MTFYAGSFWETAKFFFLFLIVSLVVNPAGNPVVNLLLLWISAGQMGGAVLFFLIGYAPEKFSGCVKFLAFWKFIGAIPSLVFSLSGAFLPRNLAVQENVASSFGTVIPGAILLVDSLFIVFLILYKPGRDRKSDPVASAESLPSHSETTVEEK